MGKESKNGLAKQGLNLKRWIRPKISFLVLNVRTKPFEERGREKRRREEEEGRRKKRREGKPRYGTCIEIDIAWYGNFGKDACLEILLENTCLS